MSFIFLRNRVTGGAAFSPASLFASGEEGAWFDLSTTAAFKSTTDLTPCEFGTGVITDQQCGFLLDKSKGAGYSGGSFTGLGSELVAGGEFNDAGDLAEWTAESAAITLSHDAANQRMQVVTTSLLSNGFYQDITTVAGAGYFVSIDATRSDINTRAYNGAFLNAINVGGTDTLYFIAESTTTRIYFRCPVALATYFVDNISVRELPGNHATQATSSARPILARVPETGRRNLLERTEEFDNAYWSKLRLSVTANSDTAPDGTITADTITATENNAVALSRSVSLTGGVAYTAFIAVKKGVSFNWTIDDGLSLATGMRVNGASGAAVTAQGGGFTLNGSSVTTHPDDSNYWLAEINFTKAVTDATCNLAIRINDTDTATLAGSATTGAALVIWGAQLEAASSASAYQKVVDQYNITEGGVTSLEYLAFDGSDDRMATAAIDFTATDKMSVFSGVERDASHVGIIAELSAIWDNNTGSFIHANANLNYTSGSRGDAAATGAQTASAAGASPAVVSGLHDISGDSTILRANGTQIGTSTAEKGVGNFGNYQLYIGSRAGTSVFFNGKLFSLIVRGAASTAQEITNTESYVANLSGVSL